MEGTRDWKVLTSFLLLLAVSASQNLATFVNCRSLQDFSAQKNYYSSHTHVVNPPKHMDEPECNCTPSHGKSSGTPTRSSHGGAAGYYNHPPSPTVTSIIPTPRIPVTPSKPITRIVSTPPSLPFIPVNPNTPGTCIYWSKIPTLIWGVLGYYATLGGLFGPVTTLPFGSNLSVHEALMNTRCDGFGAVYREGTAAFLNTLVNKKFYFTTTEVRQAFASALVSEKAAAHQARVFKLANAGHPKKKMMKHGGMFVMFLFCQVW